MSRLDPSVVGDPRKDPAFASLVEEEQRDAVRRRRMRNAVAVAVAAHVILVFVKLPEVRQTVRADPRARQVMQIVQTPKFVPPEPRQRRRVEPERVIRVPIPDPTPDDPEPVREYEVVAEVPALTESEAAFATFIPGPPPSSTRAVRAGGDISEPRRLFHVVPVYTEEARQQRVQGTVILDVRLDRTGSVKDVRVLRPLGHGLTESAVEAVRKWRYEPSRLDGEPVEVMLTVTVTFSLA